MSQRADRDLDRLEVNLGHLLHGGVLTAAGCLAVGLLLWAIRGTAPLSSAILALGFIVLMATPIMRVVVSLVAYIRMRDWFFVTTTVLVFLLLALTGTLAWREWLAG